MKIQYFTNFIYFLQRHQGHDSGHNLRPCQKKYFSVIFNGIDFRF